MNSAIKGQKDDDINDIKKLQVQLGQLFPFFPFPPNRLQVQMGQLFPLPSPKRLQVQLGQLFFIVSESPASFLDVLV